MVNTENFTNENICLITFTVLLYIVPLICRINQTFVEFNKSFMSTLRMLAILIRVGKSGCDVLVHHFDTVEGVIPSCSDNHLLVFFFSTSNNFRRLISSIARFLIIISAKIVIFSQLFVWYKKNSSYNIFYDTFCDKDSITVLRDHFVNF